MNDILPFLEGQYISVDGVLSMSQESHAVPSLRIKFHSSSIGEIEVGDLSEIFRRSFNLRSERNFSQCNGNKQAMLDKRWRKLDVWPLFMCVMNTENKTSPSHLYLFESATLTFWVHDIPSTSGGFSEGIFRHVREDNSYQRGDKVEKYQMCGFRGCNTITSTLDSILHVL